MLCFRFPLRFCLRIPAFAELRRHDPVHLCILREMVDERHDTAAIKDKPLAFSGPGDEFQLVRADPEVLREDRPVFRRLVQHADIFGVLENVLDLPAAQKILDILGNAGRDAAPFTEALPDLDGILRCLFLAEQQVELVDEIPCRLLLIAVDGNAVPDLVLHDKHAQLFELLAEILDVVAHDAVYNIDIGTVIEDVEGSVDIELKCRGDTLCLDFALLKELLVEVG
jgi:hypothetical protein